MCEFTSIHQHCSVVFNFSLCNVHTSHYSFWYGFEFHSMGALRVLRWMKNKWGNLWEKYGNLKSVVHVQTPWTQNTIIKQSQVSVEIKNLSRKNSSRHHLKATIENNEMTTLILPLFWRQGTFIFIFMYIQSEF